jgi:hypothetical protein
MFGIAALFALAVCGLYAGAASAAGKHHHRVKPRPMYWGAWIGSQLTGTSPPTDMGAVSRFEELAGKGMSLVQFSSSWLDCHRNPCGFFPFPAAGMQSIRDHGSIPFFSWGSEASPRLNAEQPDFQLSDINSGRYDSYIAQFANEARNWGHPYFMRFDWEMNGNWFPWSESVNGNAAGEYIAAWRRVHDIFTSVGATNATWVWCPYADEKHKFRNMRAFYPGAYYVDWTCMDGYNWGKNPVNPQRWKSFGELFDTTYKQLTKKIAPRKPIMLAEFATSPNGGHKAAWLRNMFAKLPVKYPRVRGFMYFDALDRGVDWPIETSATATAAFATGVSKGIYANNRFGELAESPIRPLP